MIRVLFSAILLAVFLVANGQQKLEFEVTSYDFGNISEDGGVAEYTFNFVNTGDVPVKITHVKASCGCTTPGWSMEEVQPGESGFVKARFNPVNRPGRFRKSLRITTTNPSDNRALYIEGVVKPRPKTVLEEMPVEVGGLRLKMRSLNLGVVTTERTIEKSFDVYNPRDSTIALSGNISLPEHLMLRLEPNELKASEKGTLIVTYDPVKKDDLGFVSDSFRVSTTDDETKKSELNILATIVEFFPEMTAEELDKAPQLSIADRIYDFGKVQQGDTVMMEFTLSNSGREKLNIRKIKSNCACVTYEMKSKNIKRDKSAVLRVFFDTRGRRKNQYKSISIFSNDPSTPTQVISIRGHVEVSDNDVR